MAALSRPRTPAVLTLGHSNRDWQAFRELLAAHGVERLADVRRFPRSRRHPQFNREVLAARLAECGIAYDHHAELGGHRRPRPDSPNQGWPHEGFRGYADYMQTAAFERAVSELAAAAGKARLAVMCAEALPRRCHRWLLSNALAVRGLPVTHVLSATATEPHRLTAFAENDGTSLLYPFTLTAPGQRRP